MRFEVKLGNELIGFSELEGGDASMGCAFGRFLPTPGYTSIQPDCIKHRDSGYQIPSLTVEVAGGVSIESSGGVKIIDFSPELGEVGIQIHLLGVTNPPYDELFPHHVEADEKRFG